VKPTASKSNQWLQNQINCFKVKSMATNAEGWGGVVG
jgi:hypothetical protein